MNTQNLYGKCEDCGCDLWASFTEAEKKQAETFAAWTFTRTGKESILTTTCRACHDLRTQRERDAKIAQSIRDHEHAHHVLDDFAQYGRPPAELVAKNEAHWLWAETWRPCAGVVYCYGPEGTGKSSLCRFLLYRTIAMGEHVIEVPATAFSGHLWLIESVKKLDALKYINVLMLDDISNARWSVQGLDSLRTVIDYRHETGKATLITSNMDKIQLTEFFNTASDGTPYNAMTLLRRFSPCKELQFTGKSYRTELKYGA